MKEDNRWWRIDTFEDNKLGYKAGDYLLDEMIWEDAGIYLTQGQLLMEMPMIVEQEIIDIVDDLFYRLESK